MNRVLVVEDDTDIRESLIEVLQTCGYDASGANDGRDALDKLTSGPRPQLILLDLMMPNLDGRGFREEQLKRPDIASIPVVVVSASSDVVAATEGMSPAMRLKKPLRIEELLAAVRQICDAPAITARSA